MSGNLCDFEAPKLQYNHISLPMKIKCSPRINAASETLKI